MRRLAGIDLNGWRDLAIRNWVIDAEGEVLEGDAAISGGIGGSVVQLGDGNATRLVGGAQAALAPHGRGPGWGNIGDRDRRRSVRDLLRSPESATPWLSAAIEALSPKADVAVCAIGDTGQDDERLHEAMLRAMRHAGIRRPLLIWRPVLAILEGVAAHDFSVDSRIGVVTTTETGLASQTLVIRTDANDEAGDGALLAPERQRAGCVFDCAWGLRTLRRSVLPNDVRRPSVPNDPRLDATCWVRSAMGEPNVAELVRKAALDWIRLEPQAPGLPASDAVPDGLVRALADCDHVVLETCLAEDLAAALEQALSTSFGRRVRRLDRDTVALGARLAAGRLHEGKAIYYDFLPQVSTIVTSRQGPYSHDLIDPDEVLPAGQLYRSPRPARFVLTKGAEEVAVYLKKETDDAPRLHTITLANPPAAPTEVSLSLEQQPAAGRARLTLSSDVFAGPMVIDWDKAATIGSSWEDIIEDLRPAPPDIPDRLVSRSDIRLWGRSKFSRGLSATILDNDRYERPDWHELAQKAGARINGRQAIDSDGQLPAGVDADVEEAFDRLLAQAADEVHDRMASRNNPDNEPLKFATYSFQRCPEALIPTLLKALKEMLVGDSNHPLLRGGGSSSLILHGIGRTLAERADIEQVVQLLMTVPPAGWNSHHVACMAYLLARTDEAPALMTRAHVDHLAEVVERKLVPPRNCRYTKTFKDTPMLMVGILRWRMVEPFALVLNHDDAADRMATRLDAVIADLNHCRREQPRLDVLYQTLKIARDALAGKVFRKDILGAFDEMQ